MVPQPAGLIDCTLGGVSPFYGCLLQLLLVGAFVWVLIWSVHPGRRGTIFAQVMVMGELSSSLSLSHSRQEASYWVRCQSS